jgi:hypothetical protein
MQGRPKPKVIAASKKAALAAFKGAPIGPPSDVRFHPSAEAELEALKLADRDEWNAAANVVEKLRALGPNLRFPHTSAVKGAVAKGTSLRELRPRQGRSVTRPLYQRFGGIFVILAVAPEAQADGRGYDAAVAAAVSRMSDVEVT